MASYERLVKSGWCNYTLDFSSNMFILANKNRTSYGCRINKLLNAHCSLRLDTLCPHNSGCVENEDPETKT